MQLIMFCDISHDYEIIINQSDSLSRDKFANKKGPLSPFGSSVFWIPSLVCPALSLSAFEVKH